MPRIEIYYAWRKYIILWEKFILLKTSKELIFSWGVGGRVWGMIIYPYPLPFVVLGVSNTGILDVENSKPVFDPDFHTELIIKDEYEDSSLEFIEFFNL